MMLIAGLGQGMDERMLRIIFHCRKLRNLNRIMNVAELRPKELEALETMRNTFAGSNGYGMSLDDATLLRYLRARSFNVTKAVKMLNETIAWRRSFDIPKLYTEWKPTIALENSTGKMYVRGFDNLGRPIVYMKPVNENTKDHDGNIKHLVYTMERAVACMDAAGLGQTKLCLIIDFGGYSTGNAPPMKTSKETLSILQSHYPERLHCAYCIRAPYMVYGFFKVISPFIDPVTKQKICMMKNAELGKPGSPLFSSMDPKILEACVGGLDNRPFNSVKYLSGSLEQDFLQILENGVRPVEAPAPTSTSTPICLEDAAATMKMSAADASGAIDTA